MRFIIRPLRSFAPFLLLVLIWLNQADAICAQTSDADPSDVPQFVMEPEYKQVIIAAVDSLYNLQFEASRELMVPLKKQYPDHPIWPFWEGLIQWWNILPDLIDESKDEVLYDKLQKASDACDVILDEHPRHVDALMIKAVAEGLIARQLSNRDHWFKAIRKGKKAYNTLQKLKEADPDNSELYLADGLYYYYADYIPEAYPVTRAVTWFLLDGDRDKGLRYLRIAADSSIFTRMEALYFLGNIQYNYEHNPEKAIHYFERLHEQNPQNIFYIRLLVQSYIEARMYDRAHHRVDSTLEHWPFDADPFGEVVKQSMLAWKGYLLYKNGRWEQAEPYLLDAFKLGVMLPGKYNRPTMQLSCYYLGRTYDELGRPAEAKSYLQVVAGAEENSSYVDRADEFLKRMD